MLKFVDKKPLTILLAVVIFNCISNSWFQLYYDEAYYWVWSKHLALSYYDHPPMVAYLIALTNLLGHNEFLVRLPAVITSTITVLVMSMLAHRMFGKKVANVTMYLAIAWPMLEGSFILITPDAPLLMFWSLTLYSFYLGAFENRPKQIYLSGAFAGLAFLSKYTSCLLFPGLLLFLLISPKKRQLLLQKDIYLALLIAIIVASPTFIWNYQHHFVSFFFQLKNGYNQNSIGFNNLFAYISSQIGVANPFLMLPLIFYICKYFKEHLTQEKLAFLFCPFIVTFFFFGERSLFINVFVNWTSPGFISAIILLAFWFAKFNKRSLIIASLSLIFIAELLLKTSPFILPKSVTTKINQLQLFLGFKELVDSPTFKHYTKDENTTIFACDYGSASRLWFYLNPTSQQKIRLFDNFQCVNQYQYWEDNLDLHRLAHAVFICDRNDPLHLKKLAQYYNNITFESSITEKNAIANNALYIYSLSGVKNK